MTLASRKTLRQSVEQRMQAWLGIRIPASSFVRLDHRSIFIFPSRAGGIFLAMLVVLLLAAINYQNSMRYSFTFLLGAVFAVSILHSYRNLAGLSVQLESAEGCFPGEVAQFRVRLNQDKGRSSEALELRWKQQGEGDFVPRVDEEGLQVSLGYPARKRGLLCPERLLVQSFYPFGLVRTWTWLDLQARAPVYPKPVEAPPTMNEGGTDEGETRLVRGSGDYQGLRQYTPGDSFKHIAWKQFAHKGEFFTKEFASHHGMSQWLNFDDYRGLDVERRLAALAERVVALCATQQSFGLRLPGGEIGVGSGRAHRDQCLTALALYGIEPMASSVHPRWGG